MKSTQPRAGVTLQINSMAALERLLGGDTEMEVSLRNSIAAQFVDAHLEALTTEAVREASRDIQKIVKDVASAQVATDLGAWKNPDARYELTPATSQAIKRAVEAQVSDLITSMTAGLIARVQQARNQAATYIDIRMNDIVNVAIDSSFERRVDAKVEARLKQLREMIAAAPAEDHRVITVRD